MDVIVIISIISAVSAVVGLVITNFWNSLQRKDKIIGDREVLEYNIEKAARTKLLEEEQLARELERKNEELIERIKEELRDYVDKGDLDVKRELAYAVKLIDKDIAFIKNYMMGTKTNKGAV